MQQFSEEQLKQLAPLLPLLAARSTQGTSEESSFEATIKPSGELKVKGPATAEANEMLQQLYWLAQQNSQQVAEREKERSTIAALVGCAEGCIAMLLLFFLVCGVGWCAIRGMERSQPPTYRQQPMSLDDPRLYPMP